MEHLNIKIEQIKKALENSKAFLCNKTNIVFQ